MPESRFGQVKIERDPDSYDPALGRLVRDPTLEPGYVVALPELPPHYSVAQGPEPGELEWYFDHAYVDPGTGSDGFATRDDAVAAAWTDFRESGDPWAEVLPQLGEVSRLRELVAFHKGCAEAAAGKHEADDGE
jgi:hypothetical protein